MAKTQVKILESSAGETWSRAPGDIIEVDSDVAAAWIKAGSAIIAPGADIAAGQIQALQSSLDDATKERDALKTAQTDLQGKLASASATNKGLAAEMAVHKKAASDAQANVAALSKQVADLTQERDGFKTQAKAIGDELAAYMASVQPASAAQPAKTK